MLKILRKRKIMKKIFYVLAVVIIPAFILWGSSVIFDKKNRASAGKIFKKNVSYTEYSSALEAWHHQIKMQYGDMAYKVEKLLNPEEAVWDRIILTHETQKRKIKVSDKEITAFITELPFLQKDGVFQAQSYELFLRYGLNTTPRVFEEEIRQSLKFQKLSEQVTNDISVSEEEIKNKYTEENQEIKTKYISILSKDMRKGITVSNKDIEDYYASKKEEFKEPLEKVTEKIKDEITQARAQELAKNKIGEISAAINERKNANPDLTFEEIAKQLSLSIKESEFFKPNSAVTDLSVEFRDAAFKLKDKEISKVVPLDNGYAILEVSERKAIDGKDYQKQKETVKSKLLQERKNKSFEAFFTELKKKANLVNYNEALPIKIMENPFSGQAAKEKTK